MPKRIPAQELSAYEVYENRVDQLPVFPAALMHTCSAILKEAEWSSKPNTVCVCVCVCARVCVSVCVRVCWGGYC